MFSSWKTISVNYREACIGFTSFSRNTQNYSFPAVKVTRKAHGKLCVSYSFFFSFFFCFPLIVTSPRGATSPPRAPVRGQVWGRPCRRPGTRHTPAAGCPGSRWVAGPASTGGCQTGGLTPGTAPPSPEKEPSGLCPAPAGAELLGT